MNVLEELKQMQSELESLNEEYKATLARADKIVQRITEKEAAIDLAVRVAAHYEEQIKEQRELTNESFRTLHVKWLAGGATNADFKQYAEDASYDFEIESPPDQEEGEAAA